MLQNKQIFKRVLPFLFLFILSVGYVGIDLTHRISAPSQAADEDINISFINISAPINTNNVWEWRGVYSVKNYFKEPITTEYKVNWCSESSGIKGASTKECDDHKFNSDFKYTLAHQKVVLDARNTTSKITHQSIDCGRVEIRISDSNKILYQTVYDTGQACPDKKKKSYISFSNTGDFQYQEMLKDLQNVIPEGDLDSELEEYKDDQGDAPPIFGQDNPQTDPITITPDNPDVQPAIDVTNYIIQNCGGRITVANADECMKGLNLGTKNDDLVKQQIILNVAAMARYHLNPYLQCVGFVKAVYAATTGENYSTTGNAASRAGDHGGFKFQNKTNGDPPKAGDMAVWTDGSDGHIAYIVRAADDIIEVVEANRGCDGCIRYKSYPVNTPGLAGWLSKP